MPREAKIRNAMDISLEVNSSQLIIRTREARELPAQQTIKPGQQLDRELTSMCAVGKTHTD